jgi:hypothetical protein
MPVSSPPVVALQEFLGPTTRHTRRVEIYEQDGRTRWAKDTQVRLKTGSVSVDYDRDERRSLDMTLDNSDEMLVNAPGEFWYDKILKVYRGVVVREKGRIPKILVLGDRTGNDALGVEFRDDAVSLGFGDVRINPLATDYQIDVAPYDIIIALGGVDVSGLLEEAYNAGKSILTMRESSQHFFNAIRNNTTWGTSQNAVGLISPLNVSDTRTLGWTSFAALAENVSYQAPASDDRVLFGIAYTPGSETTLAISSGASTSGGQYIAVHYPLTRQQFFDEQFRNFLLSALNWLNPVATIDTWEVQIGEFMIDRISEPHRPREIKITGRDYTKKCMLSKYTEATQFAEGQPLETVIAAIAGSAGITKRILPATGVVIGRAFFYERGKTRWEAMKEICTAYKYEIYFDATGYLTIRPFRDPSTTAPILYIETGKEGQLASYEKSTSDAELYNHVLVVGESSDTEIPPVWADAINTDPNSPTSVAEIGDRYLEISSAFVQTTAQAQTLADSYLAIHSLEEFELSFESLMLPWLEVGDILGFVDPRPAPGDPSTFLLSNLSLPLALGPMSGTGKRITIVG